MKTRLAADIGGELAAEVYRALTVAVMKATKPADPGGFNRVVCFAPHDAKEEIGAWLPGESLELQAPGDLGKRMDQAFSRSFHRGSKATVLVGTDSLAIDDAAVTAAFAELDTADVVLREAQDGGYTLIALKSRQPGLFQDIAWSTETVMAQTLSRASEAGLRVAVHGPDADIDTVGDLNSQLDALSPHLGSALERRVRYALERSCGEGTVSAANA